MDEVIFAGNVQRRPLGMAEITLTFDNSDGALATPFDEVAVTRRVYRTGESEYFLNKAQVRLRDVVDLMLGTGLGPDASAIVSQGEIDALLSAKPHERRQVFEEAAGTSKYQARKREAQRRLEQTESNALRINDILAELEGQIPAAELAVRRATRHRRLTERLRDLEVLAFVRKTQARQNEKAELNAVYGTEESDRAHAQQRRAQQEAEAARVRSQEYQTTLALDERNSMRASAAAAVQEAASLQASADARADEAARLCASLESDAQSAASQAARAEQRLRTLLEEMEGARRGRDDALTAAAQAATAETQAAEKWEQAYAALRELEDKRAVGAAAVAEIDATVAARAAERDRLAEAVQKLTAESEAVGREASQQARRADAVQSELRSLERELADALQAGDCTAQESAASLARLDGAGRERDRSAAAFVEASARLKALVEVQDAGLGIPAGVRAVQAKKAEGALEGILGTVADLIDVDEAFAAALDAALATRAHDVVARSAGDAQHAIAILKSSRAGRATFLPLDAVSAQDCAQGDLPQGARCWAADVVHCADEVRPAVRHVLREVVVADAASATTLAREHPGLAVVTLDGDIFHRHSISGGSPAADLGPIARRGDVAERRREADALAVMLRKADDELTAARVLVASAATQAEEAAKRHSEARQRLRDAATTFENASSQAAALKEQHRALGQARGSSEAELERAEAGLRAYRRRAAADRAAAYRTEEERALAAGRVDELARALSDIRDRHRVAAAHAAAMVERVAKAGDDIEAAREAAAALRREQESRVRALAEAVQNRRALAERRAIFASNRVQADATLADVSTQVDELRARRDALSAAARSLEDRLAAERQSDREQSLALERRRIRMAEVDAELAMLATAFEHSPATEEEREDVNRRYGDYGGDVDADIRKTREEQQRLGNVNLNAVEDQAALAVRRDFLRGQLDDLERARADVVAGIGQIDEESQRQFTTTFDSIASAFSETFARLFSGGKATLMLATADDPTQAGVEICAQPPGKKMQSLNSLSGGERAMTAVALIFAIIRVRPSPFYIFDEIDAALDEANIGRFGELLGELADQAQTLIITHNKATMTLADRLYGVTMHEPGVSEVLSLAMEQVSA